MDRFLAREAELKSIVDILRANMVRETNQHVMLTGPRGIGKSMLALRVVAEVRQQEELREFQRHRQPLQVRLPSIHN